MNEFPSDRESAAEEEASRWAAKLDGSIVSAAERAELEQWLSQAPSHRALLAHYCQFSTDLEEQLPLLVAAGRLDWPVETMAPQSSETKRIWVMSGGLAAVGFLLVVLMWVRPSPAVQKFATPVAQRQALTLPDGTRVELNARTTIQVESSSAERRVRLAEGEAFFRVSKDKTRPFIVETPTGSVRVTGTVFDLRSDAVSELDVTVVEGSVQVRPSESNGSPASAPVALGPGDHLSARATGVSVNALSHDQVEDITAWREGTLVFVGTPLSEALARFAHYHGRGITVSPKVANLRIGGRHSLDDLDGFLGYISEGFPAVRVVRDLSGNVRVSLRTEP